MRNSLLPTLFSIGLLSIGAVQAQVTTTAVTDAASFVSRTAPGSLASVFGTELSSDTAPATTLPLPLTLGGSQVLINGVAAPLLFVSPTQINFQMPSSVTVGNATISVVSVLGTSTPVPFTVTTTAPGLFQDFTSGQAIAQNAVDFSLNTPTNPVAAGGTIVVYVDGLGAVTNPVPDGTAALSSTLSTAVATVTATLGTASAPVVFAGLTPGFVGLAQLNIQIPSTMLTGTYPLLITVGGLVATSANISVSGSAAAPVFLQTAEAVGDFGISPTNNFLTLGNTLYFCGTQRIRVFDITNPSALTFLAAYGMDDLNGYGINCAVNGTAPTPFFVDLVGPGSAPTFSIYSLANPQVPAKLAQISPNGYTFITSLTFSGNTGFTNTNWFETDDNANVTAQHGDFFAYDFTNPAAPAFISALQPDPSQPATNNLNLKTSAQVVNSTVAYLTSSTASGSVTTGMGALDVINISTPTNMQGITQVVVPGTGILGGFAISGTTLLALGNTAGLNNPGIPDFNPTGDLTLTTMDVSNPLSPTLIATVDTGIQVTGARRIVAIGNNLFAITYLPPETDTVGPSTLAIVDASTPTAPVVYPYLSTYSIDGLAYSNGYLYLANFGTMQAFLVLPQ